MWRQHMHNEVQENEDVGDLTTKEQGIQDNFKKQMLGSYITRR